MSDLVDALNRSLYGFTQVISIEIMLDEFSREYPTRNLRLVLGGLPGERIELFCFEICELELRSIYQVPFLRAKDVRSLQLDRINLKFKDEEQSRAISFCCFSAQLTTLHV